MNRSLPFCQFTAGGGGGGGSLTMKKNNPLSQLLFKPHQSKLYIHRLYITNIFSPENH